MPCGTFKVNVEAHLMHNSRLNIYAALGNVLVASLISSVQCEQILN